MSEKTDLVKQQKIWYKKLKDSGFEDIESSEDSLKSYSNRTFNLTDKNQHGGWQFKAEYYRMASHLLHDHEFKNERQKYIWELHTNGISVRDISRLLKKSGMKSNHQSVWLVVKNLRQTMFRLYNILGNTING